MKVGKEFKFWNSETRVSQGYYVEVDLVEFPQLEARARENSAQNETVHDFLTYTAVRRSYQMALKEGVITTQQFNDLLRPFEGVLHRELKELGGV